jgi:membrane associated rhomboid family serine protease
MSYRYSRNIGTRAIWILILANFVVFIATLIAPQAIDLLAVGRTSLASRPWTIFTSLFVHAGWFHIFGNMYMLWFYGDSLERIIGEWKFLVLYFVGGLVGNAAFLLIAPQWASAVGASGAVFTIGGALAIVRPKIKVMIFPLPIPMDLWISVILTAVILGVLPALSQNTYIGWQAHLGGLVTGLAYGLYFRRWERSRGIYR